MYFIPPMPPPEIDYESIAKDLFAQYSGLASNQNKLNAEWNTMWAPQKESWIGLAKYVLDHYDKKAEAIPMTAMMWVP